MSCTCACAWLCKHTSLVLHCRCARFLVTQLISCQLSRAAAVMSQRQWRPVEGSDRLAETGATSKAAGSAAAPKLSESLLGGADPRDLTGHPPRPALASEPAVPAGLPSLQFLVDARRDMGDPDVRICLDVGGVASMAYANLPRHPAYKHAMPGAWPFLALLGKAIGFDKIHWCSRVNHIPSGGHHRHWVGGLIQSLGMTALGMPWSNLCLVTEQWGSRGKGPVLRRWDINHFIDDSVNCLWSAAADPAGATLYFLKC